MKKVVSILLSILMITAIVPTNAFAVESSKKVVDSGFCGVDNGENAKWTYYDNHELVISGKGETDWYYPIESYQKLQPWNEYINEIVYVTIENGITQIGSYMFNNGKVNLPLRRITIPKSVTAIGNNIIGSYFDDCEKYVIYEGSESQWSQIQKIVYEPGIRYNTIESSPGQTISVKEVCLIRQEVYYGYTLSSDWKIYCNGKTPEPYISISINDSNADPYYLSSIYKPYYENITVNCAYYCENNSNVKLVWTIEGNLKKISEVKDALGNVKTMTFEPPEKGTSEIRFDLVDSKGKLILTDQKSVTSSKINLDDTVKVKYEKIRAEFLYDTASFGAALIYASLYIWSYLMYPILWIDSMLKGQ